MGSNVLTSLIQDAILKLCTQHVTFDASLEIDGIICITPGLDAKEIVVKMHRTIMKPVTQPDQYAPEMDTNPSTPSSTSSATPHKRQRNRQGRDIDPNAYPKNVTSNVSFDEMPKPSIYDEDSGGGGYYSSEQQQQYAAPDSTPSKSRKRRAAPAPEASTEEKYIKVEPGESEILVEEPTSVTPGNSNDGYTDPNQGGFPIYYGNTTLTHMTGEGEPIQSHPQNQFHGNDQSQSNQYHDNNQSQKDQYHGNSQSQKDQYHGNSHSQDRSNSLLHSDSYSVMFEEESIQHICNKCLKVFPTKPCLDVHTMVVHNKYCEVCNTRLDGEENLEQHGLTHAGLKPYQCEYCYKLFGSNWGLDSHQQKPVICRLCGKGIRVQNRASHYKQHQQKS